MRIHQSVFFISLLCLTCYVGKAQEITVFSGFWSNEYYQDDTKISAKELKALFDKDKEVKAFWKKASTNETLGYTAFAGELACAIWLGSQYDSNDRSKNVAPAVGTVGFAILAGFFLNSANKNRKKAILTYNKQFDSKTSFRLVPTSNENGMGLALKF